MTRLRTCEVYRDTALLVIGIELHESLHGLTKAFCHLQGKVEPVAVVVCTQGAISALDMQGMPIDVDRLKTTVPGLDHLLASFSV